MLQEKIRQTDRHVEDSSRITIVVHIHPDGDAIGSGMGMLHYLTGCRGKDSVLLLPEPVPEPLSFMVTPEIRERVMDFSANKEAATARIGSSDLIFCQDFNAFGRTGDMEASLRESTARKILVDHHLFPDTDSFDVVFSKTDISSASEWVYWILRDMPGIDGDIRKLPMAGLAAILAGMTTDTNNFGNSVFPSTLRMASELIAAGVDRDSILSMLYDNYRENRYRMMGYLLSEKLTITPDGVAYMILDARTQERFDFKEGESEGFVNIPLSIASVRMSIFLTEEKDRFRVSIRSKKGISASKCAMEHFNGGGHEQASGGKLIFKKDIQGPEDAGAYILKVTKAFFGK